MRALLLVAMMSGIAAAQPAPPPADPAPAGEWTGAQPAPPPESAPPPPPSEPPVTGPPSAQPASQIPPAPPPSVMDRRWGIGAQFGWDTLTIQQGDKQKVTFGVLELAGRFRIRPSIEVALALHLGGTAGDIGIGGIYAEFRYRFRAEQKWNPYALAALGSVSVAQQMATDDEKRGRGSFRIGGGLERRFGSFAVDAEIRILAVGENTKAPEPVMPNTANRLSRYGLGGGTLMIGVTYYF